jgi:twitching motility protein PilT
VLRIDGVLTPLSEFPPATPEYVETVFNEITAPEQKNTFLEQLELDFAYSIPSLA